MKTALVLATAMLFMAAGNAQAAPLTAFSTMHGHNAPMCADGPDPDCRIDTGEIQPEPAEEIWLNECDRNVGLHHCLIVARKMSADELQRELMQRYGVQSTKVIGWTKADLEAMAEPVCDTLFCEGEVTQYNDRWWQQSGRYAQAPGRDEDLDRSPAAERSEPQPSEPPSNDGPGDGPGDGGNPGGGGGICN